MKILKIVLLQVFILTACNAATLRAHITSQISSIPDTIETIVKSSNSKCTKLYNINNIWIVEIHCPENIEKQGIYISDTSGVRRFDWYDKSFNNWAWQEGCNTDIDCYYDVTTNHNGVVTELSYSFFINLSEGYYKLKIRNNEIIVSEKKIVDHPS